MVVFSGDGSNYLKAEIEKSFNPKSKEHNDKYRILITTDVLAEGINLHRYVQLMKEDMHAYRKIIKPFDKDEEKDEWITNIDYIRLFFKNIVSGESEEELEEDIKTVSENVVTKCEELLNISENFIKLKYVKKQLAK